MTVKSGVIENIRIVKKNVVQLGKLRVKTTIKNNIYERRGWTLENLNMDFSEFEKNIYEYVCTLAREITCEMLKLQDEEVKKHRDKNRYKIKDKKKTIIKTVYGEVEYSRRYYYDTEKN